VVEVVKNLILPTLGQIEMQTSIILFYVTIAKSVHVNDFIQLFTVIVIGFVFGFVFVFIEYLSDYKQYD